MEDTQDKDERNKKRIILIIFIVFLSICVILSTYLLGYKFGTIGVSSNLYEQLDVVKITPNSVDWKTTSNLQIFNNQDLVNNNLIAPNSNGTYKFIVDNDSSENIKYNISFLEKNKHDINMKFRLKIDNIYVLGNKDKWVDAEELKLNDVSITASSKTMYTVEWYWQEDENDEQIGEAENVDYQLFISFTPYIEK